MSYCFLCNFKKHLHFFPKLKNFQKFLPKIQRKIVIDTSMFSHLEHC